MRRGTVLSAGILVALSLCLCTPPTYAKDDVSIGRGFTSREAAWLLGRRFAGGGLLRLEQDAEEIGPALYSLAQLLTVTGANVRPYPPRTGDLAIDGPRLGTYLRKARPKLAAFLTRKFDASHGALFRMGLDAQILHRGYEPASPLSRETLSDLRAALKASGLPASLIESIHTRMHERASAAQVRTAVGEFEHEVRHLLRAERGAPLSDSVGAADAPRELHAWLLGGYAAQAFLLHGQGKLAAAPEVTTKLKRLTSLLGVRPLAFPDPVPGNQQRSVERAYEYLVGTWARSATLRWEYRYGSRHPYLLLIPLRAIGLHLAYTPGSTYVRSTADFVKKHARLAGLPPALTADFTGVLDSGASYADAMGALSRLLVGVEAHLAKQPHEQGEASPQSLAHALMVAASLGDYAGFLDLVVPEQRGYVTAMHCVLPIQTIVQVTEKMSVNMDWMLDKAGQEKSKKRLAQMKAHRDALWKKHGIDPDARMEPESANVGATVAKRAARLAELLLRDADLPVLWRDAQAFFRHYADKKTFESMSLSNRIGELDPPKLEGATATAPVVSEKRSVQMVKRGRRWFADLIPTR